jgi:hypothetical protein
MIEQPDDILAAGHVNWLPLPLDGSQPDLAGELRERFAAGTPAFALDAAITALTATVEELSKPPVPDVPALNLAAWVLLRDPETLAPDGFALLRGIHVAESTTQDEATASIVGEDPTYQDPVVEPLDTRSGPATSIRVRPMVDQGAGHAVHERSAVLWLRPDQQVLYVLSTYTADLVLAAEVFDRLEELAAGIEGL